MGCSFFIATSLFVNAATNPPIAVTKIPIMEAFNAPLNDEKAISTDFNPRPNTPKGPGADSKNPPKSSADCFAPCNASSVSLIWADIFLNSSEPAAAFRNCFFNSFNPAMVG
jgi:hypothetical protein